jgi:hypothetical protein
MGIFHAVFGAQGLKKAYEEIPMVIVIIFSSRQTQQNKCMRF